MKRLSFFFFFLLFTFVSIDASVPLYKRQTRVQTDGKTITVTIVLQNDLLLYSTADGFAVLPNAVGDYVYALRTPSGYEAGNVVAHEAQERSLEEQHYVATQALPITAAVLAKSPFGKTIKNFTANNEDGTGRLGQSAKGSLPSIGAPVIPIVMIEFPDEKFLPTTTMEEVENLFNQEGYTDSTTSADIRGSVRDYFVNQSRGLFSPSFKVVAKVIADKGFAYYGANLGGRKDARIRDLIHEALFKAVAAGKDFSSFVNPDVSGVPLAVVYFAGPGEHNTSIANKADRIWAKYSTYYDSYGGVQINSYFVGNEQKLTYKRDASGVLKNPDGSAIVDSTKTTRDGIGILCHELGHALGLPDFYTTNGATHPTMDLWSIMDFGGYWKGGYVPLGFCAYERNFLGWLELKDLDATAKGYDLYPYAQTDSLNALRLVNPNNSKEYYIFENRSADTWYPIEMGQGMLVTKVNYDRSTWSANTVNNRADHLGWQVFPADGENQYVQQFKRWADIYPPFQGDLFPGKSEKKEITSFPFQSGGAVNDRPLYHIAYYPNSKVVTFSYIDPNVTTGISNHEVLPIPASTAAIYDLQGRRVSAPQRGIYLMAGKKVFLP